jgi:CubicO group peptidase (beta-lactamase class C family)
MYRRLRQRPHTPPAVVGLPRREKRAVKRLAFALVVVFALIMSLAGGCVRTVACDLAGPSAGATPPAAGLDDPRELERFLDTLIAERMETYHIPSEAVAVVRNGHIVLAKGYGYADPEKRTAVDPDRTLFRIGSVSKLFVWTAIMQLVEQGELDLNADVNTYLAGVGDSRIQVPATYPEPITLAHLLTHTSGFEKMDWYGIFPSQEGWIPLEEYLAARMPERVYPPGQFHVYSNYGTSLAAYIVEQVSGMPFEDYVERFIYEPLGMNHSTFRQPLPAAFSDDLATGIIWWTVKLRGEPSEFEWAYPAGSMSTTASDMARFMIAHLEGEPWGEGEGSSHRLLEEQTARDMHSQHFTYDPRLPGLAYGFFEDRIGNTRSLYHAGGCAAFSAHVALIPEYNLGLFEVYSGGEPGSGFAYGEFVEHFFPVTATPRPLPGASTSTRQFVGEYVDLAVNHSSPEKLLALTKGFRVNRNEGGTLTFLGETWVPVAPLTFQEADGMDLAIFRTEDGNAEGRVTHLIRGELAYEKLPWYRQTAFHFGLLAACLLVFLSAALGWPVASLLGRRRSDGSGRVGQAARSAAWAMSVVLVGFVVAFALEVWNHDVLYYGLTRAVRTILVLPVLGAALAVVTLILTGAAWIGWNAPTRQQHRSLGGRMYCALVALAGVTFVALARYWGLIGHW